MVLDVSLLGGVVRDGRPPSGSPVAFVGSCEVGGSTVVPYGVASRTFERSR